MVGDDASRLEAPDGRIRPGQTARCGALTGPARSDPAVLRRQTVSRGWGGAFRAPLHAGEQSGRQLVPGQRSSSLIERGSPPKHPRPHEQSVEHRRDASADDETPRESHHDSPPYTGRPTIVRPAVRPAESLLACASANQPTTTSHSRKRPIGPRSASPASSLLAVVAIAASGPRMAKPPPTANENRASGRHAAERRKAKPKTIEPTTIVSDEMPARTRCHAPATVVGTAPASWR